MSQIIVFLAVWSISMSRTFPRSYYSVSYAIKNQLIAKNVYNRNFPCMEANYPYAIKNQRGASKKPLVGGFGCDELVLYCIRDTGGATL